MYTVTKHESLSEAKTVALALSTQLDAFVFVLDEVKGFSVDLGPQNKEEAEEYIAPEPNEIEYIACQGQGISL